MQIKANDPNLKSWIEVPANSDFPIQNLPFGVFHPKNGAPESAQCVRLSNEFVHTAEPWLMGP